MTSLLADSGAIGFVLLSAFLLLMAVIATIRTSGKYQHFPTKFEKLTNSPWQSDPPEQRFPNGTLGFGLLMVVIMAIYPFLARILTDALEIDPPYLLRIAPQEGVVLQIFIGVIFWAPAITLVTAGIVRSAYYTREFRRLLEGIELDSTKDGLRTLMDLNHEWFFRSFQEALFLWGSTAGIGIWLVLYTRDELTIRVVASVLAVLALGTGFLLPLVTLARWIADQSAGFEAALQEKKMDMMLTYLGEADAASESGIPAQEAEALIQSLPPSSPITILWEQVIRSLVALAGPFMSSFSKATAFLGIEIL